MPGKASMEGGEFWRFGDFLSMRKLEQDAGFPLTDSADARL
jgi:hypothetical protein